MSPTSKEQTTSPGQLLETEGMIERAERTPFWEASVIYRENLKVFRLSCGEIVTKMVKNREPFNKMPEFNQDRSTPIRWALRYIRKGESLVEQVRNGFKQLENIFDREEGVFRAVPLVSYRFKKESGGFNASDPIDILIFRLITDRSPKIYEDFGIRGDLVYPIFSQDSPCYVFKKDHLKLHQSYDFSFLVADEKSLINCIGDKSRIRQL